MADHDRIAGELRLGHLAIAAEPLRSAEAEAAVAEAMAELALRAPAPALWLAEMDDVPLLLGDLPGMAWVAATRHPLGMSVYRVDESPIILIQRGLPAIAERSIIRHELCHLAQVHAGRLEIFDAGPLGRWWVLPAVTGLTELEPEAERFQLDARYRAERRALERTAPPGWTCTLRRDGDGRYTWHLKRRRRSDAVSAVAAAIDRVTEQRTGRF